MTQNVNVIDGLIPPHILEKVMAEITRRAEAGVFEGSFAIIDGEIAVSADSCGCEAGCCAGEAAAQATSLPCQAMSDDELVGVIAGTQPVTHGDRVLHAYADPAVLIGSLTRAAEDFAAGFATVARLSQQLLADEI
ncbi:hypothetical protein [Methylobacterium ajmalii]|uniref:hypothetical protein n=1 Tax=Methylobacterium ajmalii TaxID=2738439 RepID=UPI002F35FB87